jgi:LPXTG-motif cell wall-anchored protein
MKTSQMVGIIVLVLGAMLLGFAYQSSDAPLDQISSALTGRYTDQTMWYLIGGIVLVLAGGLLTIFGRRS